jgi:hypothetical protein
MLENPNARENQSSASWEQLNAKSTAAQGHFGSGRGGAVRCASLEGQPKKNGRPNRNRSSFIVFLLALLCFSSPAFAKKIEIIQAQRLEFRNVTTPDGKIEEYVTITGNPAIVRIEKDELEANRIEFNKTKRKLYIVGQGVLRGEKETIAGVDFVVDTSDNSLEGVDVLIATTDIDVVGISVERLPGQLEVQNGYFSPCSRCGKVGDAYGFRAGSLTLFPGDRLIARDVTILIAGEPILYLPIMIVLLSEPSRQPRWVIRVGGLDLGGNSSGGATATGSSLPNVELDLPFTTGDFGLGFTLLRYYGDRNPAFGFGVDWTLLDLFGGVNKSRVFFIALPPPPGIVGTSDYFGAPLAYRLESAGTFDITPGSDPEDALPSVRYSFSLSRQDEGIIRNEDLRGVTGPQRRTDFGAKFNFDTAGYGLELELSSYFLNRDLPYRAIEPSRLFPYQIYVPPNTLYFPEFRFTAKDSLLPKYGGLGVQNFSITIGVLTAPYNRLNRSATFAADSYTGLITAGKFDLKYGLGFNIIPWDGASFSSSFRFEGRYYSTRNPDSNLPIATQRLNPTGEFERNVDVQLNARFSQAIFKDLARVDFTADYGSTSGESPFAFDAVSLREPALRTGLTLGYKPLAWLGFTLSDSASFTATKSKLDPAQFSVSLTPVFGNLTLGASYNLETGILQAWNLNGSLIAPFGITLRFGTGQNLNPNFPVSSTLFYRFLPFTLDAVFNSSDGGKFSAFANFVQDLNPDGRVQNFGVGFTWRFGDAENPYALSFNQSLRPAQSDTGANSLSAYSTLQGSLRFTWRGLSVAFENTLDFKPFFYLKQTQTIPAGGNPNLIQYGLSPNSFINLTVSGDAPLIWSLGFSSKLDLQSFEFYQPTLRGSLDTSTQGSSFDLGLGFIFQLPYRDQNDFRLSSLRLQFGWDVLPGFSISGSITYARNLNSTTGIFTDSFNFTPLAFTTAFASLGSDKPDVFFSVLLQGTYDFDDDPKNGGIPVFNSSANRTLWRPIFILTYDLCCYTLQFKLDTTPEKGAIFTFSFILPFGGKQDALISDEKGLRFPILPFIPPIK